MNISDFIEKFASQFVDEDPSAFKAETDFHELDTWSSFTSLMVVAMVYSEYEVELDTTDVRNADTIEDLYNIVVERKKQ